MVPEFILTRFNHFEAFTLAHTLGSLSFLFLMMAYGHILPKFRHLDIQECVTEIKSDRVSEESFLIVASVFLGTYLVGTSYDYRLVFIIPLLISLSQFLKSNVQNLALGAFGLLILYDSYWFKPTVGIISDLALLAFAPLVAYLLYKLIRVDFEHNRYRQ